MNAEYLDGNGVLFVWIARVGRRQRTRGWRSRTVATEGGTGARRGRGRSGWRHVLWGRAVGQRPKSLHPLGFHSASTSATSTSSRHQVELAASAAQLLKHCGASRRRRRRFRHHHFRFGSVQVALKQKQREYTMKSDGVVMKITCFNQVVCLAASHLCSRTKEISGQYGKIIRSTEWRKWYLNLSRDVITFLYK